MRITALPRFNHDRSSGFDAWSRQILFKVLNGIRIGCLILEEDGQVYQFGEERQQAAMVAQISVKDPSAYSHVLRNGSIGSGEAYMAGLWESPDLVKVIRLMVLNMGMLQRMEQQASWWRRLAGKLFHLARRNSREGSRRNISAHYDLSNEFFTLFLDSSMAYSSAIFKQEADTLEQASHAKFQHICERLQLKPEDHLVEIGTGWGGLAIHAARHFGCRVTTTTLSREQHAHASEWVRREGLEDRITLLLQDYRDLEGSYDKLVSVEMIEAVGHEYYPQYFAKCASLLKQDGLMLIQAITISDQRYEKSLREIDFIKRYIFPGGQLPCNAAIAGNVAQHTDMQLIGLEDITHDYARTLCEWRERFWRNIDQVRAGGADEQFIRMWHFYLCFCEGGFMERVIHTAQFLIAKPMFRSLPRII